MFEFIVKTRSLVSTLSPAECDALRNKGVLEGGMVPKVEAALAALFANPNGRVKIAPAAGPNSLLEALSPEVGTEFLGAVPST